MAKSCWYRPANTVGFFPATPGAVLAKEFQEILTEELGRLKMSGRIIEESGVSLKRLLVKVDLTGCIFREDGCRLCESGLPGGSHTRRGANYSAILLHEHPDKEGDQSVFKYKAESTDKSCLQRQVREGANLAASDADNILSSRTKYHQPSLQRITLTREPLLK